MLTADSQLSWNLYRNRGHSWSSVVCGGLVELRKNSTLVLSSFIKKTKMSEGRQAVNRCHEYHDEGLEISSVDRSYNLVYLMAEDQVDAIILRV
jgi:hypothetical protein